MTEMKRPKRPKPTHVHVPLGPGAYATVTPDCSPKTIAALTEMIGLVGANARFQKIAVICKYMKQFPRTAAEAQAFDDIYRLAKGEK